MIDNQFLNDFHDAVSDVANKHGLNVLPFDLNVDERKNVVWTKLTMASESLEQVYNKFYLQECDALGLNKGHVGKVFYDFGNKIEMTLMGLCPSSLSKTLVFKTGSGEDVKVSPEDFFNVLSLRKQ
jgi:hypothetical protein